MVFPTAMQVLCGTLASVVLACAQAETPVSQELAAVLGRVADAEHGKKLYESCAACHQRNGQGVSNGTIPAIAGQPFAVIAEQLTDFRRGTRVDPLMEHFADTTHLSYSQEIADVALFVSRLPPRVGPADSAVDTHVALVYERKCARCHGPTAEGSEMGFAPRLAGQHADYLIRQLTYEPGIRPALQETHAGAVDKLSREDIVALANHLSAL